MPSEFTHGLCIGLAGWRGLLTSDTEAGHAHLARLFAASLLPHDQEVLTTVHLGLLDESAPFLRFCQNGQGGDFSPLFDGPEGKRFARISHPSRCLYSDAAIGNVEPALELCGNTLCILDPLLWPVYLLHVLTWRMLNERPILVLHAGVCAINGLALVLVGPSGSGKSTLCWALAQQGADFFSDECAVFDLTEYHLFVWPHRASLRPGGVALLATPPDVSEWHPTKPQDPKCAPELPEAKAPCPTEFALIFVMGFCDTPALTPLPGGDAAFRLTQMMASGEPSGLVRLEIAADMVSRASCQALTIGNPDETAKMLIEYARTANSSH